MDEAGLEIHTAAGDTHGDTGLAAKGLVALSESMGDPMPLGTPVTVAGRPAALGPSLPSEEPCDVHEPQTQGTWTFKEPKHLFQEAPLLSLT